MSSPAKTYTSKLCRRAFASTQPTKNSSPFISLPRFSMAPSVASRLQRLTLTDVSPGSFQVYIFIYIKKKETKKDNMAFFLMYIRCLMCLWISLFLFFFLEMSFNFLSFCVRFKLCHVVRPIPGRLENNRNK